MEKLTMCRICLVQDVSMYEVANKDLQEMYEKLTDIPFLTKDCRPMLACFFCYTKLKQCCQLLRKCLKAEEVFAQILNGDYEKIPLQSQGGIEFYGGLIKTSVEHMSIDDVCQTESGAITVQLPAVCDVKDEIEIKEEYLSDEVKVEYLDDSCVNREDIPSHHSALDSGDEVPLMRFKTEEEEVHEKMSRAPVAKKPKLDVRKAKLEDTIKDKQKKNGLSDWKIIHTTRNKTSKSVNKFRDPIASDTIRISDLDNSINNKDKESHNKETYVYNNVHTSVKPYKCDICQQSFTKANNLSRHSRIHTGVKPYKCDICHRSFIRNESLKLHIHTHTGEKPRPKLVEVTTEKPYKCEICKLSFTHEYNLISHIRIHTGEKPKPKPVEVVGEKPYKCKICQLSFALNHNLKSHIRTHTGEKPYQCDICQRSFNNQSNLNKHIRRHTAAKPYKCDICQCNFTEKANLLFHIRTHTGEKPYKCDVCQRSFTRNESLQLHIRTHTGEKPYKCDICQRSFTQKCKLKLHIRSHDDEKPYKIL